MGTAVAPSTHKIVFEDDAYLSFPAIVAAGGRLTVIFRVAQGNPLDYDSRIMITHSTDGGETWDTPAVWIEEPDCDSRNCGGNMLDNGRAHFVYDLHHREGWRRPYVRFSDDALNWSEPVFLNANDPAGPPNQITSIVNQGIRWDADHIYFPIFRGLSVLYNERDGSQEQMPMVPRHEPAIALNNKGELVAFSKGGHIDISYDRGHTWMAASDVGSISQPDLIQLADGRVLLCYSGPKRMDEWLLLSEDGHDIYARTPLKIFEGEYCGELDSRGKAMCIESGGDILSVLYESNAPRGKSRIYLVRTPKAALDTC